jgi:pimeloyl-ACP methyl ester carboxylesterase
VPAPILPIVRALWSRPKNFMSLGQYVAALPVSAAQAAAVSSLADLPLVVLSGEHHACGTVRRLGTRPRQLSSCGRLVVASDGGHWIHLDHSELVTGAICEVVAAARSLSCPSSNLTGALADGTLL